jgi:hypothetical protein
MDARLTMRLLDAMVDSTQVIEATAVAAARNSRLTVDTMRVRTPFATLTATGTFGLAEGTDGTLTYAADVNTLSGLQRWIATGDTSLVPLRPLVRQRAAAQVARGDSLRRTVDSANIGAMATRRDGERPKTPLPSLQASDALARDSIAGSVSVRGTVKGGIDRFTAEGKAAISQLVWGGNEIGRGTVNFTWADVRTPDVLSPLKWVSTPCALRDLRSTARTPGQRITTGMARSHWRSSRETPRRTACGLSMSFEKTKEKFACSR